MGRALALSVVLLGLHVQSLPAYALVAGQPPWPTCGGPVVTNCVEAFTRGNDTALPAGIGRSVLYLSTGEGIRVEVRNTNNPDIRELSPALTDADTVKIVLRIDATFTPVVVRGETARIDSFAWSQATRRLTVVAAPRSASTSNFACQPAPGCFETTATDYAARLTFKVFNFDPVAYPAFAQGNATLLRNSMSGAYVSADATFVSRPFYNRSIKALEFVLGGPTRKADGVTANTGSFRAFLPDSAATALLNIADPAAATAASFIVIVDGKKLALGALGGAAPAGGGAVSRVAAGANTPAGFLFTHSGFDYRGFGVRVTRVTIGRPRPEDAPWPACVGPAVNCVVSFTVDGGAPPGNIQLEAYVHEETMQSPFGLLTFNDLRMRVVNTANDRRLELAPTLTGSSRLAFTLKLDGTLDPVVMQGSGHIEKRPWDPATQLLTIEASPRPASYTFAQCNVEDCPDIADRDFGARLALRAHDIAPTGLPPAIVAAIAPFKDKLRGAFMSSNAQFFAPPRPKKNQATKGGSMTFQVGAPHFKTDGTTLNTGFLRAFIPDPMFKDMWEVDPASLAGSTVKLVVQGQADAVPTISRIAATATTPAGMLFEHTGFTYSAPEIELQVAAPAAAAPPAEISLPAAGSGPLSSSLLPVRMPADGVIPVPLTLTTIDRDRSLALATGTKVTHRGSGAPYRGRLYTPTAIEDPTGGRLSVPTSLGAENAIRESAGDLVFSTPLALTLPVPAARPARGLQPARLESSGAFTYFVGQAAADGTQVSVEVDRLGIYGLVQTEKPGVVDGPLQLPASGVLPSAIALATGDARIDLPAETALSAAGAAFAGQLLPPAAVADPTKGSLLSVFDFGSSLGSAKELGLTRAATITLPLPAGSAPGDLQPVFVDAAGKLTFLAGRAVGSGIAFETDHLSVFALARVARPAVVRTPDTRAAARPGFHASWAGQSEYVDLAAGQLVDLAVRFRNAGERAWVRGPTASQANLGSSAPLDNTREFDQGMLIEPLPGTRSRFATTDEATVLPGAVGTFSFRLRAPAAAGVYRVFVRPVIDGVTWMEDEGVFLQITVR